ncbi:2-oxoacid:acceptor oxidoreductase family protein [Calderihabitans maritimus]|uniref:Pyruvate/ketoisovalerate oxidoreductase catalytic domain-containing protein n=1 Tax=Calderihabitans maritimus TaxID=1246530 RepID=A0A1Z5HPK6_9FIRM|nr:2-oxoacid:acceptor oxidoreductase family protein [Calderihabitans maritimus]GAW91462.1 hypothetical protein KKC1_06240 [Calderihabitans maritimus]
MGKRWEIILSGIGGQGLGLGGRILAEAGGIDRGLYVAQTQSYGARARGGYSQSSVIISEEEILYPLVQEPNLLLALGQRGYQYYAAKTKNNGLVIFDEETVQPDLSLPVQQIGLPMVATARKINHERGVTILALGAISLLTSVADSLSLQKVLERHFRRQAVSLNVLAFKEGMRIAYAYSTAQQVELPLL